MNQEEIEISNKIEELFAKLSPSAKVSTLSTLYWGKMTCSEKDSFLSEIEN